jgi:hypothetical protein
MHFTERQTFCLHLSTSFGQHAIFFGHNHAIALRQIPDRIRKAQS